MQHGNGGTSHVTVIDYGMGNLGSIVNMLKKIGANAILASDPASVAQARKLILPGIGAFDHGMIKLRARGLIDALSRKALDEKAPVLGICLGAQLITQSSEEGVEPGLGWISARTVRFQFNGAEASRLRVPHMGWNTVRPLKPSPLLTNMPAECRFYFVHSYHVVCNVTADRLGETHYGIPFTSIVEHENIIGAQFHPEKSHKFGMQLLKNFVERF
jgi:glutamine amidotransferase